MHKTALHIALFLCCGAVQAQAASLGCNSAAKPQESPASAPTGAAIAVYCPPIKRVQPEYPSYAKRNHIVGTVEVELSVGLAGEVEDVRIIKTPHSSLSNAVERAVRQWQFPAQGTKSVSLMTFHFR